jgi:hypothetical protein
MSKPAPESRSIPAASISNTPVVNAMRTSLVVKLGFLAFSSAAIAPACGVAAEVP